MCDLVRGDGGTMDKRKQAMPLVGAEGWYHSTRHTDECNRWAPGY